MKDDLTVTLVDCINNNEKLSPAEKLELIAQTLRDCKQKKIGKIIMDAVESKKRTSWDGFEGDVYTKKRKVGRPKGSKNISTEIKERTENQKNMIKVAQEVGTY